MIREIPASDLTDVVAELCISSNIDLPADIKKRLERCSREDPWPLAQNILETIRQNYRIAAEDHVPICQDTGMACVFLEIGQDVHITGDIRAAVDEGVRRGYKIGYLRKSVVEDPLRRKNTGDNTPAVLYTELVPGDRIRITVAPKGFGSENMSQLKMLKPSDGEEGVKNFVLRVVDEAGPNPCPPIVVGVGIGGTFDKAALLAKKAIVRSTDLRNSDPYYANMEAELLERINRLGIGPQGIGGASTALAVNIETMPTHIAGLPVAVNISCHVTRHSSAVI